MNIIGLIPARGGSKGVPRKNIRLLQGKPLLCYTAEAALKVSGLAKIVLSTEDKEIAKVGKECGLDVPFLRPAELASDNSPTLPVIQHAIRMLENNDNPIDAICLLQPTSPFRDASLIERCIKLFIESGADTVITLLPVPEKYNPYFIYFQNEDGKLNYCMGEDTLAIRRQDVQPAYLREGSVYIIKRNIIMEENSLYGRHIVGCLTDAEKSINIDTMEDWRLAENYLREQSSGKEKNTGC